MTPPEHGTARHAPAAESFPAAFPLACVTVVNGKGVTALARLLCEPVDHHYHTPQPQAANPLYLWMVWDPAVRQARRTLVVYTRMMLDHAQRLRNKPPPEHTIAGEPGLHPLVLLFTAT